MFCVPVSNSEGMFCVPDSDSEQTLVFLFQILSKVFMLRRQNVNYKKPMFVVNCWPSRMAAGIYRNLAEMAGVLSSGSSPPVTAFNHPPNTSPDSLT